MATSGSTSGGVAAIGAVGGPVGAVGAVAATARLQPVLRDLPGLMPGHVLRLAGGPLPGTPEAGWRLESLDSGQVLTLIEPPLDDLQPGDQLLLRVRTVSPRLELEVMERRAGGASGGWSGSGAGSGGGSGVAPSAWGQLSALRADLAQWRRQLLATPMLADAAPRSAAALISGWTIALAHGQVPTGPTGEPLWLLPLPYWVRQDGQGGTHGTTPDRHASGDSASSGAMGVIAPEELALSLLLRWRGEAIGLQLEGSRAGLTITVLAEQEPVLTALRAEMPRVLAALVRAGFKLRRLSWRRQPLWVPVDPFPPMRSEPALLAAAAELVSALA